MSLRSLLILIFLSGTLHPAYQVFHEENYWRFIKRSGFRKYLNLFIRELSLENSEHLNKRAGIVEGLIKLIFGFPADACFNLEAESRHIPVRCLLNLTVFETSESISVHYSLRLAYGETVCVNVSQNDKVE